MFNEKFSLLARRVADNVRHTVGQRRMLTTGQAILVGVSGGPDSVALLHMLHRLRQEFRLGLGIAHFHHAVRGRDADADAGFVKNLSQKLNIVFYYEKNQTHEARQTGRSPEERLREARYEFLHRIAGNHGFDKIAVGHHADDNAEQILLNLLRGSGSLGISGIPPVRGKIIRPLIRVRRDEILAYLSAYRLDYRMDPTNADRRFLRNRIRHELAPMLRDRYNPKLTETLCRLGSVIETENDWLDQMILPLWEKTLLLETSDRIDLSVPELGRCHLAARRRLIRRAIQRLQKNLRKISYLHIEAVIDLLPKNIPARLDLPDRIRVISVPGKLIFEKSTASLGAAGRAGAPAHLEHYSYMLSRKDITGRPVYIKEIDRVLILRKIDGYDHFPRDPAHTDPHQAFLDWDRLAFPIQLRSHRPGDRFRPLGLGGTQKLSDFFINQRIDRRQRSMVPVLVSGEDIVWVAGHRIADAVKITSGTRCLLQVEIRGPGVSENDFPTAIP